MRVPLSRWSKSASITASGSPLLSQGQLHVLGLLSGQVNLDVEQHPYRVGGQHEHPLLNPLGSPGHNRLAVGDAGGLGDDVGRVPLRRHHPPRLTLLRCSVR